MSTRVTHDIGDRIDVCYDSDGGGKFEVDGPMPDGVWCCAILTPEQATQLRHHLTVWLEARPVTQFGMGGPIVRVVDIQEKLRTMDVGGPSQGIDADRKAWVESLNAWAPRADGAGSFFGCTPSNPVHLLTSQQPALPSWSSTPPTEPGWYWLDSTPDGLRVVQLYLVGDWWTVAGLNTFRTWRASAGAHERGWKWWSERLTPPGVDK